MIEGKCPKCGLHCAGWALLNPRHQTCPECGTGLEISDGDRKVVTGYSPFGAERYLINPPNNVSTPSDKKRADRAEKTKN